MAELEEEVVALVEQVELSSGSSPISLCRLCSVEASQTGARVEYVSKPPVADQKICEILLDLVP